MPSYTYGGQALIEGVLMRGRDAIAVAMRHPDGRIVTATERLDSGFHGRRSSRWPFIRGLVVLYETLVVGTRWLVRSASLAASEEGVELGKGAVALSYVRAWTVASTARFGLAVLGNALRPEVPFVSPIRRRRNAAIGPESSGWLQPLQAPNVCAWTP